MQIETLKGELFGTRSNLVVMIIRLEDRNFSLVKGEMFASFRKLFPFAFYILNLTSERLVKFAIQTQLAIRLATRQMELKMTE